MKTFGKKLFSLMLAVLMLVGAMPLAAMADEADVQADAGTPVVVEDGTNTYNENGTVDGSVSMQEMVVDTRVKVTVSRPYGGDFTAEYTIKSNYDETADENNKWKTAKAVIKGIKLPYYDQYDIDSASFNPSTGELSITVTPILTKQSDGSYSHKCTSKTVKIEDAGDGEHHTTTCQVCGDSVTGLHNFPQKPTTINADEHKTKCSTCGYEKVVSHGTDSKFYQTIGPEVTKGTKIENGNYGYDGDETVEVITPASTATCKKKATYAKVKFVDCGRTVGGEEYGTLADHDYDSDDKCKWCRQPKDGEETYNVSIVLTRGGTLVTGTAKLTKTEVNGLGNNESSAKKVLAKTRGADDTDQKIIDAYAKSSYIRDMGRGGQDIEILVTEDLSKTITDDDNKTVHLTVYGTLVTNDNGQLVEDEDGYDRILNVGESYFTQIKQTDPTGKRTLVSMRIYKDNGSYRTIDKNTSNVSGKVQSDDTEVYLIWSAKQVTVKFYRTADSNDSNGLVATRVMRAGEIIDNLPTLDGQEVDWYLENGQPLQEQSTFYDFNTDVIRAYPGGSSGAGVYLFIYKNGNTTSPISNEPVSITKFVSSKGYITTSELTSTIEKAVGQKNLKITGLFDYSGWSDYVQNKSTTKAYPNGYQVGTSSERTYTQFLYVMVNAGSSSSSSKADSSNPKTGDTAMIGTAFAVMAVAAIGLGTATVVLKKKEEF